MKRILMLVGLLQVAAGGELRVVSYNIKHGEGMDGKLDLKRIAEAIAQMKPDLVALQEVDKNCRRSGSRDLAAELGKLLGMEHRFGKSIDHDGGEYGVAVLSKLPILKMNHFKLPGGGEPRTALEVQVKVAALAMPVSIVSIHNDFTSEEVRLGQVAALLKELKEVAHPVILAGDFNAQPKDVSLKLLEDGGWKILDKKGGTTFPADAPEIEIDFVVTRGLSAPVLEHGVIEERVASDHRPIFAVWELPEPKVGE